MAMSRLAPADLNARLWDISWIARNKFGLQLLLLYMRQERISKTETVCLGGNMLLLLVGQLLLGRNTWLVVLDHRALWSGNKVRGGPGHYMVPYLGVCFNDSLSACSVRFLCVCPEKIMLLHFQYTIGFQTSFARFVCHHSNFFTSSNGFRLPRIWRQ